MGCPHGRRCREDRLNPCFEGIDVNWLDPSPTSRVPAPPMEMTQTWATTGLDAGCDRPRPGSEATRLVGFTVGPKILLARHPISPPSVPGE